MTLVKLDLDRDGNRIMNRHDKRIIIDADTIAFASCSVCEYEVEDGEYEISVHEAVEHSLDKLRTILDRIGGKEENTYLYFTGGRESFRYQLLDEKFEDEEMRYKYKRRKKHTPAGLDEVKRGLGEHYNSTHSYLWEADDQVVYEKKKYGDDSILVAVDKDVIMNTPGRHFNYYESKKYKIDMKWMEVSEEEARFNQYIQAITGE